MLTAYETAVVALLQAPSSPVSLVPTATIDLYINIARGQVAGQGKCVRQYATLDMIAGTRSYPFSAVAFTAASGIAAPNAARMIWYQVGFGDGGPGQKIIANQPFEWFGQYRLNNPVPGTGPPTEWAQLGQGQLGTLFFDPVPDIAYVCPIDVECAPAPLIDDNSPEVIPPLWRDPVPFYAAWLALMQLQRQADADMMLKRFQDLMSQARQIATPEVLPGNFEGSPDLTLGNKLGAVGRGGR